MKESCCSYHIVMVFVCTVFLLMDFHGLKMEALEKRFEALEHAVEVLKEENIFLKERLAKYENPKNSRNSQGVMNRAYNFGVKTFNETLNTVGTFMEVITNFYE